MVDEEISGTTRYGPNPKSSDGTPIQSKGKTDDFYASDFYVPPNEKSPATIKARKERVSKQSKSAAPRAKKPAMTSIDPETVDAQELDIGAAATSDNAELDIGVEPIEEPHIGALEPQLADDTYIGPHYPYAHVTQSESGHVNIVDDTLGVERLLNQHKAGSFEEYLPNGDRRIKVIGDGYEIIAGKKDIYIGAGGRSDKEDALNITVNGNVRQLIKGDYILEVQGDYHEKIHGHRKTKIGVKDGGGNYLLEIRGNYSAQINEDYKLHVTEDYDLVVEKNRKTIINGKDELGVVKDLQIASSTADVTLTAFKNLVFITADSGTGTISLKSAGVIDSRSVGKTSIVAGTILDLNSGGGSAPSATNSIKLNSGVDSRTGSAWT